MVWCRCFQKLSCFVSSLAGVGGIIQHEKRWRGYMTTSNQLVANSQTRLFNRFHKQVRCKQARKLLKLQGRREIKGQGRVRCLKCDWMNR